MKFLQENISIQNFSNFKTPAKAKYFYEIKNEAQVGELFDVFTYAKQQNFPTLVIGGGTNMLFAFDEFPGIIIKNSLQGWNYDPLSQILLSYSNEKIRDIAKSLEQGFHQTLWHRFIGLPGSIGGAVFGNAGCFGLETENNFLEATVLDTITGEVKTLNKAQMSFSYRSSLLKQTEKYFLIKARFDLSKKVEKYHSDVDNIDFRENKQPKGNSCGSFFKNPDGYMLHTPSGIEIITDLEEGESLKKEGLMLTKLSAGGLIEQVGLKGFSYGGAKWSEKHANFLLSDGQTCTWHDLMYLIEEAQKRVKQKFDVQLENEVRIITI